MADLITEYAEYDEFAREYHSGTLADYDVSLDEARRRGLLDEQRTQKLWQLLGLLDFEELLMEATFRVLSKHGYKDLRVPTWPLDDVCSAVHATANAALGAIYLSWVTNITPRRIGFHKTVYGQ
ncbi:hypothetical protein [Halobellus inordinatus]|uniref:hypothetical protein n=1 Tax=Halobellus inordinatus TaxID=1126236 RepID=UPI00210A1F9F|nr:hypothetical protein [Halobellus inordinatus]